MMVKETVKLVFLLATLVCWTNALCPRIISREEWGARPPNSNVSMSNPVPYVIIHHGASIPCSDMESCKLVVRSYQTLHMDNNGWDDIGYSFIVGGDGNVYQGRGWSTVGAHAPGYNDKSTGICFIGNFESQLPDFRAINAVWNLIQCGIDNGHISPNYFLKGHRDTRPTECPGEYLYQFIKTWPNFENPS